MDTLFMSVNDAVSQPGETRLARHQSHGHPTAQYANWSGKMIPMVLEQRTDLSDLVRTRRAELRLSLRTLAERTIDPEDDGPQPQPQWKYGRLGKLEKASPDVLPPTRAQLRGLAAGLGLAPDVVMEAHKAQFVGIRTHWDPTGEIGAMTHGITQLNETNRAIIADLIETMRKRQDETDTGGKPDGS
jgi:transcriptional regulator with XRE-family HTH domain